MQFKYIIEIVKTILKTYLRNKHVPTGLVQAPSFFSAAGAKPKDTIAPDSS